MTLGGEGRAFLLALGVAMAPRSARLKASQLVGVEGGRLALAVYVFGASLVMQALRRFWFQLLHRGLRGLLSNALASVLQTAIRLPVLRGIVQKAVKKELTDIERKMHGDGDPRARLQLPAEGMGEKEIINEVQRMHEEEVAACDESQGRKWGGIYHLPEGPVVNVQNTVWGLYNSTNALYEGVFPSVRKFEAELVSWVMHLVHGDTETGGGVLTSGGTESVLIGALAYREQGVKRGIARPRIVAANTCHPAIVKACHYFGMELTKIPVNETTGFALSAKAVRPYLTRDVVCIYASAPTFPHGVVDHIEDLAALARSRGVGVHVDNCMGGILLSYLDRQQLTKPHQLWDFRAKGVTSISVDIHKYGNASKGVSVVAFAERELRQLTYVPVTDGCEGLYVTSTLQGSRGGAGIAQAWATMLHYGEEGYMSLAREMHELHSGYQAIVERIPGLRVLTTCHACIIPITSDKHNIYGIASLMEEKGWNLFTGQFPPVLSVCIGELHKGLVETFEADLRAAVAKMEQEPTFKPKGAAAVYGAMATTPGVILEDIVRHYMDLKLSVKAPSGEQEPTSKPED